jgi:hypothetical protein
MCVACAVRKNAPYWESGARENVACRDEEPAGHRIFPVEFRERSRLVTLSGRK